MKELENYLQLISQMIKEENSNFRSFLQRLKKKSESLNQFPCSLPQKRKERTREEEKRL